jgi:hypothetical protein
MRSKDLSTDKTEMEVSPIRVYLLRAPSHCTIDSEPSDAIAFLRQPRPDAPGFTTLFSARSLSSSALRGRAIVSHVGASATTGVWRCSKDPGLRTCAHIIRSTRRLEDLIGDGNGLEQAEGEAVVDDQARAIERLGTFHSFCSHFCNV